MSEGESGRGEDATHAMRVRQLKKAVRSCEGAVLMERRVRRHDQEGAAQNRHGGCVLERAQPKGVHQVSPVCRSLLPLY